MWVLEIELSAWQVFYYLGCPPTPRPVYLELLCLKTSGSHSAMEGQHPWKACGADGLRPSIQLGTFKRGQNSLLGAGHLKRLCKHVPLLVCLLPQAGHKPSLLPIFSGL